MCRYGFGGTPGSGCCSIGGWCGCCRPALAPAEPLMPFMLPSECAFEPVLGREPLLAGESAGLRRWMLSIRLRLPCTKKSLANSQQSGSALRKPCSSDTAQLASRVLSLTHIHMIFVAQEIATESSGSHIGVELPHKAGKVVVLEVLGQQVARKVGWLPYNEAVKTETHTARLRAVYRVVSTYCSPGELWYSTCAGKQRAARLHRPELSMPHCSQTL